MSQISLLLFKEGTRLPYLQVQDCNITPWRWGSGVRHQRERAQGHPYQGQLSQVKSAFTPGQHQAPKVLTADRVTCLLSTDQAQSQSHLCAEQHTGVCACLQVWQEFHPLKDQFSSLQSLSHAWLFAIPWTAPHQVSLSIIVDITVIWVKFTHSSPF